MRPLNVYYLQLFIVFHLKTAKSSCIKNIMAEEFNIDTIINESLVVSYNILDHLNDDCLIHIFECLPLLDLCNVADVGGRFQWNAVSVFKRKYSTTDLNDLIDDSDADSRLDWDNHDSLLPMKSVDLLFRCFGEHIKTLYLDKEDFDDNQQDRILELMITFCTNKNAKLDKLVMHGVAIRSDLMSRLQPLFDRLKLLDVTDGSYYIGSELTEVILEDVDFDYSFVHSFYKPLR